MAASPHPTSTAAPLSPGDGDQMFRHTFLCRLPEPSDREAIMQMGQGLDSCMREMGCWGPRDPRRLPAMAAALADDVAALAAYATTLAREGVEAEVPPGEVTLCRAATQWAEELTRLAVEIRGSVAAVRGVS